MSGQQVQATLDLIKGAARIDLPDDIAKSFSQSTGLVNYDLEAYAKLLYPVLTPMRNIIPRVKGNGGTATNWKQITGVNINNMTAGVSEGQRGGAISDAVADKVAAYKGLGLENYITFEADYAAQGFDDARARAVQSLLNATMIQEERIILGGNNSLALGTTGTPTLAAATTGGTLATATLSVICVALAHRAWRDGSVAAGVPTQITRTNMDGTTDVVKGGHANKSTAASVSVTGPTGSVTATVAVKNGAAAYAWYWGASGSETLGAITSINSVKITANATGTQLASALAANDQSQDSLLFDGLLTQLWTPGSGAYNVSLPTGAAGVGTGFTSDGAGGINELDDALQAFWDNYRLSPDVMWVSGKTLRSASKVAFANGSSPVVIASMNAGGASLSGGTVLKDYLNKITNKLVAFRVHPDLPDGMVVFWSDGVPYPISNVANILQIKTRQEYVQREWPLRTRRYEFGVYADELLQCYFPPAFGVLNNIAV
jgi:hypothetical protein